MAQAIDAAWTTPQTLQNAAVATGYGNALGDRTSTMPTASGFNTNLVLEHYNAVLCIVTIANTATVTFEGAAAGVTNDTTTGWYGLFALNMTTGAWATTATASGLYLVPTYGISEMRARISSWSSGAVTVVAQPGYM